MSECLRTVFFEEVKIRRVQPSVYRVCDIKGQGSQYHDGCALPMDVRKQAEAGGVVHAYGYITPSGRWSVRTKRQLDSMKNTRQFV